MHILREARCQIIQSLSLKDGIRSFGCEFFSWEILHSSTRFSSGLPGAEHRRFCEEECGMPGNLSLKGGQRVVAIQAQALEFVPP